MKKIDLSGRPLRGNKDAKVTVVVYDDFQCPFCARLHGTVFPEVFKDYASSVRFIYKDFPLGNHPWAMRASVNGNCLAEQNNDAYWEYSDFVHANQRAVSEAKAQGEEPGWVGALDRLTADYGRKHSLDANRLQACIAAQNEAPVRASMEEGTSLGVNATPTLFINGQKIEGAVPAPQLRQILDEALREAGQPVPTRANAAAPPAAPNQ
jgi:protein-disulfide isomerase